ncbi:MAG: peptide MFS transporter [Alphaproteobacteria bacterium]|nr:peptide MFS transporter [Alphaproteobacteria bacterium]
MTGTKFLDQPRGVRLIAATEFWERFSYYGFTGLATLFMAADPATGGLGMEKSATLKLFGITVGMIFMAPLLGGWIADRLIGPFRSVIIGCLGLAGANFLLAAAGTPAAHAAGLQFVLFYCGLAAMIVGAGMFKSNVGSLMGQLFTPGDHRRKNGFMLFYMGINMGAFCAPYGAGTLGERTGWAWGFLSAGVGMMIGLFTLLWLSRGLFETFIKPLPKQAGSTEASVWRDPGVKLVLIMVFFTAIYMIGQQTYGGVMNLYVRDRVDKMVLGFDVPTTWFLSLNPLIIILGGPFVSKYWAKHDLTAKRLPAITKIFTGTVLMALSYVLMVAVDMQAGGGLVAPIWIVVFYLVITLAELCVFPIGLAEISQRAPKRVTGVLMGLWVFTMGFGSLCAGWLGGTLADVPAWVMFATLAGGGTLNAIALFAAEPMIRRKLNLT